MISVQNLQQPLSGNKKVLHFLFAAGIILLASCSTKKPVVNTPVDTDNTEVVEDSSIPDSDYPPMDTVQWNEIDLSTDYENVIEELGMNKKESYSVKLFFPFEKNNNKLSDVNQSETKLGRMAQYYAGVLLALDQLDEEGVDLDVEVLDAESGNFDLKLQSMKDADVIIGPRNTDQLAVVANFGKVNEIVVVSPWKSGSRISKGNPFFVQLKTGLVEHYDKMVKHALDNHELENIVLLGRKKKADVNYMRLIQSIASAHLSSDSRRPLREFFVDEDSLITGETAFDSIFIEEDTNCFIMPHWSFSADEDFVYNVARKMSGEKGVTDVVLYGMPILFESDKIRFELFRSLNMRIVRSSYVDRNSPGVQEFRQNYFSAYNDFPVDEAYEAYDMMLFVGRSLERYGLSFPHYLDREITPMLQTHYDIRRVYEDAENDDFEDIDYFQNQHLFILSFEDDRFIAR